MKKQNKGFMAVIALAIVLVAVGATYAFITFVVEGTKTNTITGGNLVVNLDETANGAGDVTISNAFPVSDAVGKGGTAYKFTLSNESEKNVNYTISLVEQEIEEGFERIPNSAIKVYLTNGDDTEVYKDVTLLSNLGGTTLATGTINAKVGSTPTTKDFNLRLWIADSAIDTDVWTVTTNDDGSKTTTGKQFASKISVEANQVPEFAVAVTNETQLLNQAVFYGGTATFTLTLGSGTPSVQCSSGTPTLSGNTLTVANITTHTTCSVTYN